MHSNLHAVYWIFTTIQSRIGTGMINAHTGGYCAGLLGPHNKSPYYRCNYILTGKENQIKNTGLPRRRKRLLAMTVGLSTLGPLSPLSLRAKRSNPVNRPPCLGVDNPSIKKSPETGDFYLTRMRRMILQPNSFRCIGCPTLHRPTEPASLSCLPVRAS